MSEAINRVLEVAVPSEDKPTLFHNKTFYECADTINNGSPFNSHVHANFKKL